MKILLLVFIITAIAECPYQDDPNIEPELDLEGPDENITYFTYVINFTDNTSKIGYTQQNTETIFFGQDEREFDWNMNCINNSDANVTKYIIFEYVYNKINESCYFVNKCPNLQEPETPYVSPGQIYPWQNPVSSPQPSRPPPPLPIAPPPTQQQITTNGTDDNSNKGLLMLLLLLLLIPIIILVVVIGTTTYILVKRYNRQERIFDPFEETTISLGESAVSLGPGWVLHDIPRP